MKIGQIVSYTTPTKTAIGVVTQTNPIEVALIFNEIISKKGIVRYVKPKLQQTEIDIISVEIIPNNKLTKQMVSEQKKIINYLVNSNLMSSTVPPDQPEFEVDKIYFKRKVAVPGWIQKLLVDSPNLIVGYEECRWCKDAKDLLTKVSGPNSFMFRDIYRPSITPFEISQLMQFSQTVPVIFLKGEYIGGYTELYELIRKK